MSNKKSLVITKLTAIILTVLMLFSVVPVSGLIQAEATEPETTVAAESSPDEAPTEPTTEENTEPITAPTVDSETNSGGVSNDGAVKVTYTYSVYAEGKYGNEETVEDVTCRVFSKINNITFRFADSINTDDVKIHIGTTEAFIENKTNVAVDEATYNSYGEQQKKYTYYYQSLDNNELKLNMIKDVGIGLKKVVIRDNTDNEIASFCFYLDLVAPTIANIEYDKETKSKQKDVFFTAIDTSGLGIDESSIKIKGLGSNDATYAYEKLDGVKYKFTASDVTQKYKITVLDKSGQKNEAITEEIVLDTKAPEVESIEYLYPDNSKYTKGTYTNQQITVKFKFKDEDISEIGSVTVKGASDNTGYTATPVAGESGWYSFVASNSVSQEYIIKAIDKCDNGSETNTEAIKIDNKAPDTFEIKFESVEGSNPIKFLSFGAFGNQKIKATVKVVNDENASAVDEIWLYNGNSETTLFNGTKDNNVKTFIIDAEAQYDFYIKASDKAGNVSDLYSIKSDNVIVYANDDKVIEDNKSIYEVILSKGAPGIEGNGINVSGANKLKYKDTFIYNGNISFNATVKDDLTGLETVEVYYGESKNYNSENKSVSKLENITSFCTIIDTYDEIIKDKVIAKTIDHTSVKLENGEYVFVIIAKNNSGNSSQYFANVKRDNQAPDVKEIKYEKNSNIEYAKTPTITFEVYDMPVECCSGLKEVTVTGATNKKLYTTTKVQEDKYIYSFIADATQAYVITVKDIFGETREITTDNVLVDNQAPNIKNITFDTKWSSESIEVKFDIDDIYNDQTLSDVNTDTIKIYSPNGQSVTPVTVEKNEDTKNITVTFIAEKYGNYEIQVKDNAENEAKATTDTIKIDDKDPELKTVKVESAASKFEKVLNILTFGIYSNDNIKITIEAKDAAASSGITDLSLKIANEAQSVKKEELVEKGNETEGYTVSKSFELSCDDNTGVFDICATITDKVNRSTDGYVTVDESGATLFADVSKKVEIVATKDAPAILKSNETQGIDISFDNGGPLPNAEGDGTPEVYSGKGAFSATVKDDKSGIKDIYAYFGKADEFTVSEDGTVTTTDDNLVKDLSKTDISKTENKKVTAIPIEYKTDSIESGIYTFAIVTINNSGNSTTELVTIAIDNTDPVVEGFEFKTAENAKTHYAENTFYTNKNVDVIAKASDASPSAGFTSIEIFDGEVAIGTSPEYLTLDAEYRMELSKTNEDYVLKATATDQFSHTNTLSLENTASIVVDGDVVENVDKVQIDTEAPKITGFKFAEVVDDTIESHSESEYERDYGYFFENNVAITVTATDKSGSGVQGIYFVTTDVNGNGSSSYAQTKTDPIATFTIPANFKGHIYAYAVDNLYQEGKQFCPNDLVVEDKFMHDNTSSIVFSRAATGYKDVNGLDLYDGDVPVTITVEDTFSGLAKVEYTVEAPYDTENNVGVSLDVSLGADKKGTNLAENGWTILGQDKNLVTKMTKTIMVSNNSNNIVVKAKITDNAGFEREETITPFSIDKTNPVVEVTYDNHDFKEYQGQKYYKADRTATITVTERNFNAAGFKEIIDQPYEMGSWSSSVDTSNPDNSKHTVQIKFSSDDDYTVDMTFKDLVDRPSNAVAQEKFTIDKTNPNVNVSFDNNSSLNNNYFKAQRTATITINEHNFAADAEHLAINITALGEDNASAATPPSVSGWSTSGDVHTATITFANDGKYAFTVDYKDLAYNNAEQSKVDEFYVDKTEPDIKFANVENNAAYSGEIAPKVILTDNNYNGYTTFTLQRIDMKAKAQVVDFDKSSYMTGSSGEVITFDNFSAIEDNDGIYKLTVKMMDKAGNEKSAEIVFSVNRFGSTFLAGNEQTQQLVATGYTNAESDIVIKEVNVNKVSAQTISLALNNSDIRELKLNQDFTVANSGGSDSWHEYSYSINKDNFVEEGYYTLTLSTTDSVEHTLSNRTALTESRKYPVSFTVDKTDPSVRITGVEANVPYEEASKTVRVICEDANINPETIVIKLNGEVLEAGTDFELTNENAGEVIAIFDVEAIGNDFKQSIEATVVDFAGNDNANDVSNFILSASLITRFFANTPLVIITFSCLGLAIATVVIIIVKKRKRDEQN